jgi:hypothetical protein
MRLVGRSPYKKLEQVKEQALQISRDSGCLCVYEKAKYKTRGDEPPAGRYLVCYRLWVDLDQPAEEPKAISIKDWKKVEKEVSKRRVTPRTDMHTTGITQRWRKQGRF